MPDDSPTLVGRVSPILPREVDVFKRRKIKRYIRKQSGLHLKTVAKAKGISLLELIRKKTEWK